MVPKRRNGMEADWKYEPERNAIKHISGLQIEFDGEPESTYFTGSPRHFPQNLSNIQIASLIREGFDFYRTALVSINKLKRPILKLKAGAI
jgi:hypothetical protein